MIEKLFRLAKHSAIYGLGITLSRMVHFLLLPIYAQHLTIADYGSLEIFLVTYSALNLLFIMGFSSALFVRYFKSSEETKKTIASTAFLFITCTSFVLSILLAIFSKEISLLLFKTSDYSYYLRILFLNLFFNAGVVLNSSIFRANEEPKKFTIIMAAKFSIEALFTIMFVVIFKQGILGILKGGLISSFIIYIYLIPNILKNINLKFSIIELKEMLKFGLPLIPATLAAWVMTASDRYFLQHLSTPDELGLYSLGYKFGLLLSVFLVSPFQMAWVPFMFSMEKEPAAKDIYSKILTYYCAITLFFALIISILSKEMLAIMTAPQFYDAYKIVPFIVTSYLLYGLYFIFNVGLGLTNKTKYTPFIVATGATTNLILNYLLIPSYGMLGASVATIISYLLLPVGSYFVSQKYYPITYEWIRIAKLFVAAIFIFWGSLFVSVNSLLIAVILKLIILLGFPGLLFLLKFFKPMEIKKIKEIIATIPNPFKKGLGK